MLAEQRIEIGVVETAKNLLGRTAQRLNLIAQDIDEKIGSFQGSKSANRFERYASHPYVLMLAKQPAEWFKRGWATEVGERIERGGTNLRLRVAQTALHQAKSPLKKEKAQGLGNAASHLRKRMGGELL